MLTTIGIGLLAILFVLMVSGFFDADGERRREILQALMWGGGFALLGYLIWNWYGVEGLASGWAWITGPGLPWIGIALLATAGFIWYDASRNASSSDELIDELTDRTTEPVLNAVGVVSAIIITLVTVLFTGGASVASLLGFIADIFAESPLAISNLWAIVVGYFSLGGSVPLLDALVPDRIREMGAMGWLGLTISLYGVAIAVRNRGER